MSHLFVSQQPQISCSADVQLATQEALSLSLHFKWLLGSEGDDILQGFLPLFKKRHVDSKHYK